MVPTAFTRFWLGSFFLLNLQTTGIKDRVLLNSEEVPPVPIAWDPRDVEKLKRAVSRGDIIELDFFQYPGTIGKQGERPQAGYILLALHAQSNLIFGVETLQATESIERMWGQIPGVLLHRLAGPGMRPKEIHVQSQLLSQATARCRQEHCRFPQGAVCHLGS
jgi:hypothetical protein